jgi:hypothetical protein
VGSDGRSIILFNFINEAFGDLAELITGTNLNNLNMAIVFLKTIETVTSFRNILQDIFYVFAGGVDPFTQSRLLIPRETLTFNAYKLITGIMEDFTIDYFRPGKMRNEAVPEHPIIVEFDDFADLSVWDSTELHYREFLNDYQIHFQSVPLQNVTSNQRQFDLCVSFFLTNNYYSLLADQKAQDSFIQTVHNTVLNNVKVQRADFLVSANQCLSKKTQKQYYASELHCPTVEVADLFRGKFMLWSEGNTDVQFWKKVPSHTPTQQTPPYTSTPAKSTYPSDSPNEELKSLVISLETKFSAVSDQVNQLTHMVKATDEKVDRVKSELESQMTTTFNDSIVKLLPNLATLLTDHLQLLTPKAPSSPSRKRANKDLDEMSDLDEGLIFPSKIAKRTPILSSPID